MRADCLQRVGEQYMISLQNSPGRGAPQAVLNSPVEGQNRYEEIDIFAVRKLTVNECSRCTCCYIG
jgi:hypothetical protein